MMDRREKAEKLFESGYNCCQSVVLAFEDLLDERYREAAKVISSGFGGGIGRMREVCGTVSGMAMVLSLLSGSDCRDDRDAKAGLYESIQKAGKAFEAENGSVVCRTLLGLDRKMDDPVPSERTAEYYRKRPCSKLCGSAAAILEGIIEGEEDGQQA